MDDTEAMPIIGKCYSVKIINPFHRDRHHILTKAWGRCIYVHPKGRYAMLQFPDYGDYRECFPLSKIGGIGR